MCPASSLVSGGSHSLPARPLVRPTLATYGIVRRLDHVTQAEAGSVAVVVLVALGLWRRSCSRASLTLWRVLLVALMALSFAVLLAWTGLRDFYEISLTHESAGWRTAAIATAAGIAGVEATARFGFSPSGHSGRGRSRRAA